MPGNYFFSIFSPEKLEKVIPPHTGEGEEPRCETITFSVFLTLKNPKG